MPRVGQGYLTEEAVASSLAQQSTCHSQSPRAHTPPRSLHSAPGRTGTGPAPSPPARPRPVGRDERDSRPRHARRARHAPYAARGGAEGRGRGSGGGTGTVSLGPGPQDADGVGTVPGPRTSLARPRPRRRLDTSSLTLGPPGETQNQRRRHFTPNSSRRSCPFSRASLSRGLSGPVASLPRTPREGLGRVAARAGPRRVS